MMEVPFTVNWNEVRSRAFATFRQVVYATVAYVAVSFPVEGEITFSWQGLWTAAFAAAAAAVRNYRLEKRTAEAVNKLLAEVEDED